VWSSTGAGSSSETGKAATVLAGDDIDLKNSPLFIMEMLVVGLIRVLFKKHAVCNDTNNHVYFELEVFVGETEQRMALRKRYKDFDNLRLAVSENWYVPAPFPPKQVLSSLGRWRDVTFLDERQNQLAVWVDSLLAMYQGQDVEVVPRAVVDFLTGS
jgi:hypothetical protein